VVLGLYPLIEEKDMGAPVGEMIVVDEGTEYETRVSVVVVQDASSNRVSHCLDIYDKSGTLKERVGYKTGMVSVDGYSFNGDTLLKLSIARREMVDEYVAQAMEEVHEH